MPTTAHCSSPLMHVPVEMLSSNQNVTSLSSFDYDQMCLALALIAERICELNQKQTIKTIAQGEEHHENL